MSYSISKSIIGLLFTAATASLALSGCSNKSLKSLVPDKPSDAPDYMCTWNLQGYYVSYDMAQSGGDLTRNAMNEENLFGNGKYQNCIIRKSRCYGILKRSDRKSSENRWDSGTKRSRN